jgi:hypothetical protein
MEEKLREIKMRKEKLETRIEEKCRERDKLNESEKHTESREQRALK